MVSHIVGVPGSGGWRYHTYEDLVLRTGRALPGHARPDDVEVGPSGECFRNAGRLALKGYTYMEGYALPEGGIPLLHAWCVDAAGAVVDPTWAAPERAAYFGVVIPTEVVCTAALLHGSWGLLGNDHRDGFRLLREGLPVEQMSAGPAGRRRRVGRGLL